MITKKDIYDVIPKEVINSIFKKFDLDVFSGKHGFQHWARVIENGLFLSEHNNDNPKVIIAFGFFHDSQRENDANDPDHGFRGALLMNLYKDKINLTEHEFEKVFSACSGHTDELYHDDLDIATCWDADRLDLMRFNIDPDPYYLNQSISKKTSTIELRSMLSKFDNQIEWANDILLDIKKINDIDLFLNNSNTENTVNIKNNYKI